MIVTAQFMAAIWYRSLKHEFLVEQPIRKTTYPTQRVIADFGLSTVKLSTEMGSDRIEINSGQKPLFDIAMGNLFYSAMQQGQKLLRSRKNDSKKTLGKNLSLHTLNTMMASRRQKFWKMCLNTQIRVVGSVVMKCELGKYSHAKD